MDRRSFWSIDAELADLVETLERVVLETALHCSAKSDDASARRRA